MIHGAMLVRNEAGRWLEKVLHQMKNICDDFIVLDDCSTDDTPEICKTYGADVFYSDRSYWGTNELIQRKFLWDLVTHNARFGDWVLCLDADETFNHPELIQACALQAENVKCNSLAFPLYDMWTPTHYRDDTYWNAHTRPCVVCVKYEDKEYFWNEKPLHCGRFPVNAVCKIAMCPVGIQHWGWSKLEDRQEKYKQYMKADPEGKYGILEQYKSILDEQPNLRRFT